jgi:hypothetical protein
LVAEKAKAARRTWEQGREEEAQEAPGRHQRSELDYGVMKESDKAFSRWIKTNV